MVLRSAVRRDRTRPGRLSQRRASDAGRPGEEEPLTLAGSALRGFGKSASYEAVAPHTCVTADERHASSHCQ